MEVVHSPDAQDAISRELLAHTIQQRSTCPAEVVGHFITGSHAARLCEGSQVLLAAKMFKMSVGDGEV